MSKLLHVYVKDPRPPPALPTHYTCIMSNVFVKRETNNQKKPPTTLQKKIEMAILMSIVNWKAVCRIINVNIPLLIVPSNLHTCTCT